MTDVTSPRQRPLRADAARNRERLIDVAKAAFAEAGPDVSLEEIARRARVGIGTLYRHFPTRDAIIEAVYRRELDQLADSARTLLNEMRPIDALAQWLRLSVDYIATKKLIAPAFGTFTGGTAALYARSGNRFEESLSMLVEAAIRSGDIRADITTADLMQAMAGLAYGNTAPTWRETTLRLIDVFIAGLRTGGSEARARR